MIDLKCLIDAINVRKSVRSYSRRQLEEDTVDNILRFAASLEQPIAGCRARVELVHREDNDADSEKLGTYGVITGCNDYMALIYEEGEYADVNAGWFFEEVLLYCTSIGLATCWLGGTFKKSSFLSRMTLASGEVLAAVSPVGYAADRPKLRDRLMRMGVHGNRRIDFDRLFFYGEACERIPDGNPYRQALENMRKAPSSRNSQPWRAVVDGATVRFYHVDGASAFMMLDMGIGLAHFTLTCRAEGLLGAMMVEEDVPLHEGWTYLASWQGC